MREEIPDCISRTSLWKCSNRYNMRNVEIKAKILNLKSLKDKISKLCTEEPIIIPQHDIFYQVPGGRLKLRHFQGGDAELIYYDRPDSEGPKLSDFEKCHMIKDEVSGLNKVLTKAFGIRTEVVKTRQLYMLGQTRVHIDNVKNLGDFIELEVVLKEDQSVNDGQAVAQDIMAKLGIKEEHLLATAYADLLNSDT